MHPIADGRHLVVVTDLDGTLLDAATYAHDAAREALHALRRRDVPLVLATSKTRKEVERLAASLDVRTTWIVENGGAVIVPRRIAAAQARTATWAHPLVLRLGVPRDALVGQLRDIAVQTGLVLRGFAQMPVSEVAQRTGLTAADARLACDREFDEPFVIEDEAHLPAIVAAATERQLEVTRGGRFHHLTGGSDKGRALLALLPLLARDGRRPWTIGLGDSENDLAFLRVVDEPVLVPRPDHQVDRGLMRALPQAERAPAPGPAGWNVAVLGILRRHLAHAGAAER
jgi:mannosyl-3-phosphoglycerate phosphatase